MKILHLTDTHLGAWWPVQGAPADWSRAQDHHQALCRALELGAVHGVDLIVHTGDVFDRSVPPAPWVHAAAQELARAAERCPVVVMPGNHDRHGLRRLLPLHVPDLYVLDGPEHLRFGSVRLGAVPYRRDARAWAQGARQAVAGGVDLLLAHQAFDGAWAPGITFRVGAQADTVGAAHLPAGVGAVLCGHIHPRQTLQIGGVAVVHPGPTAHTSFGDR
jgi:DNA repair exonuclease SbcCD nuclease subunit